jgi:hypothetical protein
VLEEGDGDGVDGTLHLPLLSLIRLIQNQACITFNLTPAVSILIAHFFTSKVILAQATNIYFDHPQEPDPEERGLYWATRFTDTYKVLKFIPDSLYDNIFEERSGMATTKTKICGPNSEKCEQLERKENIIGMINIILQIDIHSKEYFL